MTAILQFGSCVLIFFLKTPIHILYDLLNFDLTMKLPNFLVNRDFK